MSITATDDLLTEVATGLACLLGQGLFVSAGCVLYSRTAPDDGALLLMSLVLVGVGLAPFLYVIDRGVRRPTEFIHAANHAIGALFERLPSVASSLLFVIAAMGSVVAAISYVPKLTGLLGSGLILFGVAMSAFSALRSRVADRERPAKPAGPQPGGVIHYTTTV